MQGVKLENERLQIQINEFGAELSRIYDKEKGREVLWTAKPEIWGRHAPILFPFVGKCFEGNYCHDGTIYPMEPHGFARDADFELVTLSGDEACYRLRDNAATLAVYPFHFTLEVGHRLDGNNIHVSWNVVNEGDGKMWFMIGAHPAFQVPDGHTIYDYTLRLKQPDSQQAGQSLHYEAPDENGYVAAEKQGYLQLSDDLARITKGFFEEALTYIFDEGQVEAVTLLLPGEEPYVTVHCRDFPYLAVWTMEQTHPFVCLEPWYGRAADQGYRGELKNRPGIVGLAPGETFTAIHTIEIH